MPDRLKALAALFSERPWFWAAVAGAILVKLLTVRSLNWWQVCVTTFTAVFFAIVFTSPVLHWLGLERGTYEPAVAALLALFGEHLSRLVLQQQTLVDLIKAWRGK